MTQAIDIITDTLIQIGAIAPGESIPAEKASFALSMLNGMIDQWSNESLMIPAKQEVIHEITGGVYRYTIGNGGDVKAVFTGSITNNVLTITALTSGAVSVGMSITGTGVPANTFIASVGTGRAGNLSDVVGTWYLNTSVSAPTGSIIITAYAVRPLRITDAFVRITNSFAGSLDFPVEILNEANYNQIGIKNLQGPWPKAVYYQPTMPLGVLNYFWNPTGGEMHLFADTVLTSFGTINDTVNLPQGYRMLLMWCLAEILLPSYGRTDGGIVNLIIKQANNARATIKRTNMRPSQAASFDQMLLQRSQKDAGWIISGGNR